MEKLPPVIREECTTLKKVSEAFREADSISTSIDRLIKDFGHLSESGNDFSYPKWEEDHEMVFNLIKLSSDQ